MKITMRRKKIPVIFYYGDYIGENLEGIPAAAVISARRAGTTAAFDQMNKYFTIQ